MEDIKFIRDDTIEERNRLLEEINEVLHQDTKKIKDTEIAVKFIKSIISLSSKKSLERKRVFVPQKHILADSVKEVIYKIPEVKERREAQEQHKKIIHQLQGPVQYPLLVYKGEVMAKAMITNDHFNRLKYNLVEPRVEYDLVKTAKKLVRRKVKRNKKVLEDQDYLDKKIRKAFKKTKMTYNEEFKLKIIYFLYRDLVEYGKIDALLHDPGIRRITCNGINKAITINHNRFHNLETNISYKNLEELNDNLKLIIESEGEKFKKGLININLEDFRLKANIGKDDSNFELVRVP